MISCPNLCSSTELKPSQTHYVKKKVFSWAPNAGGVQALLQSCTAILVINWWSQGIRGMGTKELIFRLMLELAFFFLFFVILTQCGIQLGVSAIGSAIIAHSFNFSLNGQFWVCARYCRFYNRDPRHIDDFLRRTCGLLRNLVWLGEALCIGSQGVGLGTRTPRSDIDLRLIFPPGQINWLRTNFLLLRLRCLAFFKGVPLDLYAYDSVYALDRFDQTEPLYVILDRSQRIAKHYPKRTLVHQKA